MGTRPKNIGGTDPVCQFNSLFSWLTKPDTWGRRWCLGDWCDTGQRPRCETNFAQRPAAIKEDGPLLLLIREAVHLDASLQLAAASAALRKPS